MGMESKTIWLNGEFVDYEKATLHFLTPGLHYGIGVFEGIRCYGTADGPAIFRLKEHIARFFHSAFCLGFRELPFGEEQIAEACAELVARNAFDDCYIRPLLYLASGGSGGGWNLNLDGGSPAIGIAAWQWKNYLGAEALEKGVRANVSSFTRHHPNVTMTKAKISGSYANSFLAKTEAVRLGFEEAFRSERRTRERLVLHAPPPERHDDEGQDQRQLREQLSREDRVGSAGLRRSHHARQIGRA